MVVPSESVTVSLAPSTSDSSVISRFEMRTLVKSSSKLVCPASRPSIRPSVPTVKVLISGASTYPAGASLSATRYVPAARCQKLIEPSAPVTSSLALLPSLSRTGTRRALPPLTEA